MPFNVLDVVVSANTRGLERGLRRGNRAQEKYARNTERTFSNMGRRFGGSFARAGAGTILGAAGLGLTGAGTFSAITQVGNQYEQMSKLQREVLTDGQRRWRAFAGAISMETKRIQLFIEDRLGGIVGPVRDARRQEMQMKFERQMGRFVGGAPTGAARRGLDFGAITRVTEAQRQRVMAERFRDFVKKEREAQVTRSQGPGEFVAGTREAVPEPPGDAFMRGMRQSTGARLIEQGRQGLFWFSRQLWGDLPTREIPAQNLD